MIEKLTAANGQLILRQRGRLLASRIDPGAEAEAWLNKRRAFLDKIKGVFVLGLGGGYHVRALLKASPAQIVVIEHSREVIESLGADFGPRVRIEYIANARELRACESVRNLIKHSFVVLTHPPSLAQESDFYRDCAAQLNGRDWGALTWQWQLRGLPALDSSPRVQSDGGALTIYDLEQTELVQSGEERERMLIKALRELVK